MPRVFSGIQPSGVLHVGNYLGAIRNWVAIQGEHQCIYGVVDYHAITVDYDKKQMAPRIRELATGLLACGIDPDKALLFVQSDVPQHTELAWIFNTVTPMGELARQTQFKAKSEQHAENINVGLFTYPVLQAADILLYKASLVPVGNDQEQHLELSREIARKFNARFGKLFPEPRTMFSKTPRIRGLDGKAKMSKSLDNFIAVDEDAKRLRKKLARAFTDPQRVQRNDPGDPSVCNIFTLHSFFSDAETCHEIDNACREAKIGCVDCKKKLGDAMVEHFAPIRERWAELRRNPDDVDDVLATGAERCRAIAQDTMEQVHKKLGLRR
ncbi:MAG: tryptophan--tRNA ligase [Deltaproteobacteria bacterium]|nr:tryptophan--tRNA ligase [Deltaproteobacteria bacterium]